MLASLKAIPVLFPKEIVQMSFHATPTEMSGNTSGSSGLKDISFSTDIFRL